MEFLMFLDSFILPDLFSSFLNALTITVPRLFILPKAFPSRSLFSIYIYSWFGKQE